MGVFVYEICNTIFCLHQNFFYTNIYLQQNCVHQYLFTPKFLLFTRKFVTPIYIYTKICALFYTKIFAIYTKICALFYTKIFAIYTKICYTNIYLHKNLCTILHQNLFHQYIFTRKCLNCLAPIFM